MSGSGSGAEIFIRPAEVKDLQELALLSGQLGYPTTASQMAARLKRVLKDPDHAVLVGVNEEDKVIAWVHVRLAPTLILDREAEIDGIVVREDQRGRGLGERLLRQAEEWANRRACKALRLRTNVTRRRAHRFYQRLGFERVKTSHLYRKALSTSADEQGRPE